MAQYTQIVKACEGEPGEVFCEFSIGSSGACTLVRGKGVDSVTKETAAGQYTIKLDRTYTRLLCAQVGYVVASGVPAAPGSYTVSDTVATAATRGVTVQCVAFSGTSGAAVATNPASGEVVRVRLVLKRASFDM